MASEILWLFTVSCLKALAMLLFRLVRRSYPDMAWFIKERLGKLWQQTISSANMLHRDSLDVESASAMMSNIA